MPRPRMSRRIHHQPLVSFYKPQGVPMGQLRGVTLTLDGLEALRLADAEGLDQESAAELMGVSRPTFSRLLAEAGRGGAGVPRVGDGVMGRVFNVIGEPVDDRGPVKASVKGEETTVPPSPDGPFSAIVFKTISDPYTGRISLMRVFSGRVNPDGTVTNANRETDEKLGGLFFLQGKEQVAAGQAKAGDIVATAKLKVTASGDTLSANGSSVSLAPIVFPLPSISFAIEPKTRADEDRISQATHRITEEDPTVRIERDPNTSQLLISGNGELHVRIITERLKKRYNVDVDLKPPKISYLETIKGRSDVQGRHKKTCVLLQSRTGIRNHRNLTKGEAGYEHNYKQPDETPGFYEGNHRCH